MKPLQKYKTLISRPLFSGCLCMKITSPVRVKPLQKYETPISRPLFSGCLCMKITSLVSSYSEWVAQPPKTSTFGMLPYADNFPVIYMWGGVLIALCMHRIEASNCDCSIETSNCDYFISLHWFFIATMTVFNSKCIQVFAINGGEAALFKFRWL